MKKYNLSIILFFLAFCCYANSIRLVDLTGIVQVKATVSSGWQKAVSGQALKPGNFIYTGFNSSCIIQTNNAKIEVKPLSQTSVNSLISTKESIETEVYLKYGKVKADVQTSENVRTVFKVRSANSTASVRGTIFTFGENILFVESGTVELLGAHSDSVLVQKNEKASVRFLQFIDNPLAEKLKLYQVNAGPLGLAEAETSSGSTRTRTGGSPVTTANVIINIIVVE